MKTNYENTVRLSLSTSTPGEQLLIFNIKCNANKVQKWFLRGMIITLMWISQKSMIGQSGCPTVNDSTYSQSLGVNCIPTDSSAWDAKYKHQWYWKPKATDPLIGVKFTVHLIVPQNTYGNNMYGAMTPTNQYNSVTELVNMLHRDTFGVCNISDRYSIIRQATYPDPSGFSVPFIHDSRVYYELDTIYIYYHVDSLFWDGPNGGKDSYYYYWPLPGGDSIRHDLVLMQLVKQNYPERLERGLPVFFTPGKQHFLQAWSGVPAIFQQIDPGSNDDNHRTNQLFNLKTLRHEFGHAMGFHHPDCCEPLGCDTLASDYLPDLYPENNYANCAARQGTCALRPISTCNTCHECEDAYCTNNFMSEGGLKDTRWMSPFQMGRRIRNLHFNIGGLSDQVRNFVKEAESLHTHPLEIDSNETWSFDIQMYRDILVKAGATLSITCKVAMAAGGKIRVEKGAKLVVDGATLTSWCKKAPQGYHTPLWKGIEIEGSNTAQLIHNTTGYCPGHGIVELKGSTISKAMVAVSTGTTDANGNFDWNSQGGIVIAKDALFENNEYDILFYKYQSPWPKSVIQTCTFQTTGEIGRDDQNALITPKTHIKLFDNWGARIEGCSFIYNAGSMYTWGNEGIGIYSTNSQFDLDEYCSNSPCSTSVRSKFKELHIGSYIDNFNPLFPVTLNNSDYIDNGKGAIIIENAYGTVCTGNTIDLADESFNQDFGIYIYNSKYYKVRNNNIQGHFNTITGGAQAGIVADRSRNGAHEIYNNTLSNLYYGILTLNHNGGLGPDNPGLKLNCNVFNSGAVNLNDIVTRILTGADTAVVMESQSHNVPDPTMWVRNLYGAGAQLSWANKWNLGGPGGVLHVSSDAGVDNPHIPNIETAGNVSVTPRTEYFDHDEHCSGTTPSLPASGSAETDRISLNDYIEALRDGTPAEQARNKYEIQSAVASKLQLFLRDTTEAARDSVLAVFSMNQGDMEDTDILEIFALLRWRDYVSAETAINDLGTNRADWEEIFLHLLDIEQETAGAWSLADDEAQEEYMREFSPDNGVDGVGIAQGLVRLVFNEGHGYPVPEMEPENERRAVAAISSQMAADAGLAVYPNPLDHNLTIKSATLEDQKILVTVFDNSGRLAHKSDVILQNGKPASVSLVALPAGSYLVIIRDSDNEIKTRKHFLKQ